DEPNGDSQAAEEPAKPKIRTIENGLTVAMDGTGQYSTIGAALKDVKPGQTIRVLDDAVYKEAVRIEDKARMEGITLESPQGATLMMPRGPTIGLLVANVPGVTVRGFRLRMEAGSAYLCIVAGKSPGATLDALDFRAQSSSVGLSIEQLNLTKGD